MTSLYDTARANRRRLLSTLLYKDIPKKDRPFAVKMAAELGTLTAAPFHYLGIGKKWHPHDYFTYIIGPMYDCRPPFLAEPLCDEWYRKVMGKRTYDPRVTAFVKAAQGTTDNKGDL